MVEIYLKQNQPFHILDEHNTPIYTSQRGKCLIGDPNGNPIWSYPLGVGPSQIIGDGTDTIQIDSKIVTS